MHMNAVVTEPPAWMVSDWLSEAIEDVERLVAGVREAPEALQPAGRDAAFERPAGDDEVVAVSPN